MIKTRKEMLFLYDVTNANPNGDPADENKPRIDEESKKNIVTDVRLKRTVRDYLIDYMGHNGENDNKFDVFVKTTPSDKGKGIKTGIERAKDFNDDKDEVIKRCIDIRLFGGVLPLEKASITFTGPVQFKMGQSLHAVELKYIKGTGAFAAKVGAEQQTFREEYVLPYSLIAFYGVVNENAAKETKLTDEDHRMLLKSMWWGTKNLISRSKMEHMPRLLLNISYSQPNFFIGELDKYITLKSDKRDEQLRDPEDFTIDFSRLSKLLKQHADKIEAIEMIIDARFKTEGIDFQYKKLEL
ncbi:MAG: type I-B CRISPR-associated protein Cas7/Csh2 [Candidatus Cloacimonadales bacterium]